MDNQKINGKTLKKMFEFGAKHLERNKDSVDELNVFPVPDGDTGTNMSLTFSHLVSEFSKIEKLSIYNVTKTASSGALIGARGNSGVILSQLLRGFSEGCKGLETLDAASISNALKQASNVAYKAVMKPTEGTILTVAREMGEFAMDNYKTYNDLTTFLDAILKQGKETLLQTPELLPVLKEADVVDAGGQGLIYILEGALKAFKNEELGYEVSPIVSQSVQAKTSSQLDKFVDDSHMKPEDITFGYCTEFIISNASELNEETFRVDLNNMGDSIVVVKDEDIVKVHLHTDNPGLALENGLRFGQLTRIKIDNMRDQFATIARQKKVPVAPYGFIAVSPGVGLTNIFNDLGITRVISGGQTMNPSTQDFLSQIDSLSAETIFLFPNNGNILMAAEQAAKISDKQVFVIPSKTMPQCISAMLTFSIEQDPLFNQNSMNEAINKVTTGEVTFAVRDTKINGLKIKKNNIIGLTGGEIKYTGKNREEVTRKLLKTMVDDESELISIYYGQEITKETAEHLHDTLVDEFENCDIELQYGGQPLYYYIVSVE